MERRRQQSAHDFLYSFCLPTQPTKKAALALTSSNILKHFRSSSALTTRAMIFKQAQQQPGNFYSKVCAKLGTKLAAKVIWQQNPKRARQNLVIEGIMTIHLCQIQTGSNQKKFHFSQGFGIHIFYLQLDLAILQQLAGGQGISVSRETLGQEGLANHPQEG